MVVRESALLAQKLIRPIVCTVVCTELQKEIGETFAIFIIVFNILDVSGLVEISQKSK